MTKFRDAEYPKHGFVEISTVGEKIDIEVAYRFEGTSRFERLSATLTPDDAAKLGAHLVAVVARMRAPANAR